MLKEIIMGFKSFQNNQNLNNNQNDIHQNKEKVEQFYQKYKDKNENELMEELLKNVSMQKQNGTFDYQGLCNMLKTFSPYLSQEQVGKIQNLLNQIK